MTPPPSPDYVVFDVDGTLIDSAPGIINGYLHVFEELGVPAPSEEVLRADIGPPLPTIITRYGVAESQIDQAIDLYRERYLDVGVFEAAVYPGAAELLTRLDGAGVALATATAKRTDNARAILDAHNLLGFFEVLGAAHPPDRHSKAEILEFVLASWGINASPSVAMIGDRHFDIEGSLAVGIRPIGAAWGYGSTEELLLAGAESICASPSDLENLLFAS